MRLTQAQRQANFDVFKKMIRKKIRIITKLPEGGELERLYEVEDVREVTIHQQEGIFYGVRLINNAVPVDKQPVIIYPSTVIKPVQIKDKNVVKITYDLAEIQQRQLPAPNIEIFIYW